MARFRNREERERYMDSLEWQMENQREQIQRTLERTPEDSDRIRKALEKLGSFLPSFSSRTPVRGAAERETPQSRSEVIRPRALRKVPGSLPSHGPGGDACSAAHRSARKTRRT